MMLTRAYRQRRPAATLVEFSLVMIPMMMFVMGIFEYGLLLMDWNLLINATREGSRYALANNTDPSIATEVQTVVTNYMAQRTSLFSNFQVTVMGWHNGAQYTGNQVTQLAPGDTITVTASGNYKLLNLIPMVSTPGVIPMSSTSARICEGGT